MITVIFYLVIAGPLGQREVPIKKFTNLQACEEYIANHAYEDAARYPLSIGQKITDGFCRVIQSK